MTTNVINIMSDEAVLEEFGDRLSRARIDRDLTQAELAHEAGVSKRTVERIENGHSAQMSSVIRVLRALDMLENLDALVPEPGPRPVELLRMKGSERRRASSPGRPKGESDWAWADE